MNHEQKQSKGEKLSGKEVAEHNSREDCWVIIHGRAYDVTEFLPEHPGICLFHLLPPILLSLIPIPLYLYTSIPIHLPNPYPPIPPSLTQILGGPNIILKFAGKDATETYDPIHPPDTLDKYLNKSKHLGEVEMSTVAKEQEEEDPDEADRQERIKNMPPLEQCFNLMDFEAVAKRVMKRSAWAYYSSGADDEIVSFPYNFWRWVGDEVIRRGMLMFK